MKKPIVNLVIILVIVAAAIFVDIPRSNGFRIGSFTRSGNLYLGLDLQGGMQVLLEADVEPGTAVSAEQMETARTILENRSNGLGVSEVVFQLAGDNRIIAEFPGITNTDEVLDTLKGTGLLEFVDTGDTPFSEGTPIKTVEEDRKNGDKSREPIIDEHEQTGDTQPDNSGDEALGQAVLSERRADHLIFDDFQRNRKRAVTKLNR